MFSEGRRIRKTQRLLLDVYARSLARLQGRMPSSGIVWHGKECRYTRVRLSPDLRKTERLFEDIRHLENLESPPKLVLNDHCHVCEFRQSCYD